MLGGVDFRYLNTHLAGGSVLEADAWYQLSDTEGLGGDSDAFGAGIAMPNNAGWRGGLGVKEIEENFNPALGFVNRVDIRDSTAELGFTHRFARSFLRSYFIGADAQRIDFLSGELQSQTVSFRPLDIETNSRDTFQFEYLASKENILEPFEISEGVIIPVGEYSFDDFGFELVTGTQRDWSGTLAYRQGDFFDGERDQIIGELIWVPSQHFRITTGYEYYDVRLPAGDFTVRLATIKTDIIFSATLSWVNLIQYDNVTETAGINSRLHWIPEAGRELFIVLNHSVQDFDRNDSFHSEAADLTAKFNYTVRF
jgi:hypothetical protein